MTIATIGDVGTKLLGNGTGITNIALDDGVIDAAQITSGTIDPARLPLIDAATITGNLSANVVLMGELDASVIASGTLDNARLPADVSIVNLTAARNVTIAGDLTVSNLTVLSGNIVEIQVETQITDQLIINNDGAGPALVANQSGAADIADFLDDGAVVMRVHDGGILSVGGDVAAPLATVHVEGNVYATGNVYAPYFEGNAAAMWSVDATTIDRGTIDPARLPLIDASTITGNLAANVVLTGELDASLLTSGTIDPARLPLIDASTITGNLAANVVLTGELDASLLTSGTIDPERLPTAIGDLATGTSVQYACAQQ